MFLKLIIGTDPNRRMFKILKRIEQTIGELRMKMEQFQQAFQQLADETTRIADYIDNLQKQLQRDDLTDEQENEILQHLHAAAERLRSLGSNPEHPVPDEELPV